jgi:hypothetical protein
MKKILAVLTLSLILTSGFATVHAQSSCPVTNPSDGSCCTNVTTDADRTACENYFDNQDSASGSQSTSTTPATTTTNTQSTSSCPAVNPTDGTCCTDVTTDAQRTACENYYGGSDTSSTASTGTAATTSQSSGSCPVVNPTDGTCCTDVTTDAQRTACENYDDSGGSSSTSNTGSQAATGAATTTTAPGQIGSGGTQSTAPVNQTTYGNPSLTPGASTTAAVSSCSAITFTNLLNIAVWVKCVIGAIVIPGIFALATVVFLWGVFKFIRASSQVDKDEGKRFIYMGLIGLFVMVSVWGIIKIASTTLGIQTVVPTLQTDYLTTSNTTNSTGTTSASSNTATTGECATTITTQGQWDDCCDNQGATNQAPVAACDAFANTQNEDCPALNTISNQVQYDDCCDNGGGSTQAATGLCNMYEQQNGMPRGND